MSYINGELNIINGEGERIKVHPKNNSDIIMDSRTKIDADGSIYGYSWKNYDSNGSQLTAWAPTANAAAAGAQLTTVNGAVTSSTTVVVNDATGLLKGHNVYFGPTFSTAYTISSVSGNTLTLGTAVTLSSGVAVKLQNYKTIKIQDADVSGKNTFYMILTQP
jgi:hypothetical protein